MKLILKTKQCLYYIYIYRERERERDKERKAREKDWDVDHWDGLITLKNINK